MGADIYIVHPSIKAKREAMHELFDIAVNLREFAGSEDEKSKAQKLVEYFYGAMNEDGYFRDSYNATSIMGRLGLSWWRDVGAILDRYEVDEDQDWNLPIDGVRELLSMVESAQLSIPTREDLEKDHARVDDGENSPEAWGAFYTEKHKRLIAFLRQAIEMDAPLYCSI